MHVSMMNVMLQRGDVGNMNETKTTRVMCERGGGGFGGWGKEGAGPESVRRPQHKVRQTISEVPQATENCSTGNETQHKRSNSNSFIS